MTLKDDNLGLGAKRGTNVSEDQCTGLDVFQDVLGRLNGKDQTVIEAEQRSRADLKRAIHGERRWGSLRFVSGGLLVGDRIQRLVGDNKKQASASNDELLHPSQNLPAPGADSKRAKSIVQRLVGESPEIADIEKPNRTKRRRKVGDTDRSLILESQNNMNELRDSSTNIETRLERDTSIENELGQQSASKAQRCAQKAERKLQRKLRREAKEATRAGEIVEPSDTYTASSSQQYLPSSAAKNQFTHTAETGISWEAQIRDGAVGGRHSVRQRYIRQKKMAMMDTKALHEVCMAYPGLNVFEMALQTNA